MDLREAVAELYLKHLGHTHPAYEPDANVAPDFVIDSRIAVEVRRLNQHDTSNGARVGSRRRRFRYSKRFRQLLDSFGPPNRNRSWFVMMRYQRPIENWKTLRGRLQAFLQSFLEGPQTGPAEGSFGSGLSLSIVAASKPQATLYLIAGYGDWDSGGFLLEELQTNIQYCSDEKEKGFEMYGRSTRIGGLCS